MEKEIKRALELEEEIKKQSKEGNGVPFELLIEHQELIKEIETPAITKEVNKHFNFHEINNVSRIYDMSKENNGI